MWILHRIGHLKPQVVLLLKAVRAIPGPPTRAAYSGWAITSLVVPPHSQAKFRTSRFLKRSCGSIEVSRIVWPQCEHVGPRKGGPDDLGGGT